MFLGVSFIQSIADAGASTILQWSLAIVVVGSVFFEVSPIKINPISALINYIFKPVNEKIDGLQQDVNGKFADIQKTCDQICEKEDKYRFATIRWEILTFRNDLKNGNLYTANEYQHIFDDYDEYRELHDKYNFTNGYIEDAIEDINSHYNENKDLNVKYF